MSKIATWAGGVILIVSLLVISGYATYFFAKDVLGDSDVPLALRVAIPASAVGALALLGVALGDRLRARKHEHLEGADY
ncbi:MAG: hypothetical protein QGG34_06835 [SAR202 cluster bacterium]|jgi:hypothetical protein|nr:hypothetical protein [SAR202 cluster bacterium]MDP6300321.1 hypothetical protein [SAR202 cluster bacterium]MDP7103095.1 hypothetical protein [SAR202 cluster bacterium]MDP7224540.1 hypothetical protein [SAR202 cluster bacterium]MDP7413880.1 hypothetical protein [SAR202 cluster bacterium]|tara:strand:+ start:5780 stop:6016 length:237 start_codon:yes stop_codon:yes gene_type:complete